MDNEMQQPPVSDPATPRRLDLVGLATLAGVIVMATITGMNQWHLSRLTDRVVKMEAAMNSARRSGPDPNQVYTVQTTGAPTKGPENAPVTIIVFSEFQCPYCARFAPTLKQIEDTYQGSVRVVFKHLPLSIHKDAVPAALAAEAARKQGKFWE
jgi:protein-disulfide isomerase